MKLSPQIAEIVNPLIDNGLKVFVSTPDDNRTINWLIVEKDKNVGVVGYRDYALRGYYVTFPIKPSQDLGSGLLVQKDDHDPYNVEEVIELAHVATQDSYANFATNGVALPNHGWKHFDWTKSSIQEVGRI